MSMWKGEKFRRNNYKKIWLCFSGLEANKQDSLSYFSLDFSPPIFSWYHLSSNTTFCTFCYRDNLISPKNQTSFILTIRLNYIYDFESIDFQIRTNDFYSIYEHVVNDSAFSSFRNPKSALFLVNKLRNDDQDKGSSPPRRAENCQS